MLEEKITVEERKRVLDEDKELEGELDENKGMKEHEDVLDEDKGAKEHEGVLDDDKGMKEHKHVQGYEGA